MIESLQHIHRGAFTSTDQEIADHFLETHFPGCQPISGPQSQSQPKTPSTEDWLIASSVITEEKIRLAIIGFGFYKTAGENGVFPGLLQQGIETLVVSLCKVLTAFGFRLYSQSFAKNESYIHPKTRA
jgi:hypothetical protein